MIIHLTTVFLFILLIKQMKLSHIKYLLIGFSRKSSIIPENDIFQGGLEEKDLVNSSNEEKGLPLGQDGLRFTAGNALLSQFHPMRNDLFGGEGVVIKVKSMPRNSSTMVGEIDDWFIYTYKYIVNILIANEKTPHMGHKPMSQKCHDFLCKLPSGFHEFHAIFNWISFQVRSKVWMTITVIAFGYFTNNH